MELPIKLSEQGTPTAVELLKSCVEQAETLQELVFSWISDERSVICLGGSDDDKEGEPSCFVLFEWDRKEVGYVNVSYDALRQMYPDAVKLDLENEQDYGLESEQWSDLLGEAVISAEDGMKLLTTFILSDGGEVTFCTAEEYLYEEVEPDQFQEFVGPKSLFSMHLNYMNRETHSGFGTSYAILHEVQAA